MRVALACAALVAASAAPAREQPAELQQTVQQGQLVIAHTRPGNRVEFDGRAVHVGTDGVYVFGIERDAKTATVVVHEPGRPARTHALTVKPRDYKIERVDGLPQHTVTPDPELARRIAEEQARVVAARQRDDDREDFLHGFARPAQGGRISGVYGSQRIDNGTPKAPHMGLDIAVPTGTPVRAPAGGIVTFAETGLVLTGGTVLIDHGHGLSSSFLHLSRIDVKTGDRVERGQVFGAAGATGRASGPHVHWGFNWFDVRLDPALLPPSR